MSGPEGTPTAPRGGRLIGRIALIVLSVLPFAAAHYLSYIVDPGATGFIQYDMPLYVAHGREIFERGNGFTYPNPYDTDPEAPSVYFHWLLWVFGFGVTQLHVDPGLVFVVVGLAGALGYVWLTLRIVEVLSTDPRCVPPLFLIAMWGAGVVAMGQAAANVVQGRDPLMMLLRLEPSYWFTNWGRNTIFPTEAVYHFVVAASWLAALRGRWMLSLAGAALVAATHPFTGLAQLLIQLAWSSLLLIRRRDTGALRYWLGAVGCLAAFGGYYALFLPSIPQHQALQSAYSVDWSIGWKSIVVAWGPVAMLAAARVWRDRDRLETSEFFLLTCWAVSFLLATHDRFIESFQPLHFTRGYVWFPLFLLALPLIEQGFISLRNRFGRTAFVCGAVLAVGVAAADNVALLLPKLWEPPRGIVLNTHERAALQWADRNDIDGILLCESPQLCYLSATYTGLRPFVGHGSNTPSFGERVRAIEDWFAGKGSGLWFRDIDWILAGRDAPMRLLDRSNWQVAYENRELVLLRRLRANGSAGD